MRMILRFFFLIFGMSDPTTALDIPSGIVGVGEEVQADHAQEMYSADPAFMTALNTGIDDRPVQRQTFAYESTAVGKEIQEGYGKLTGLCANLDGLVRKMMDDQESSFFLAYKEHMKRVLKEFDALKHKADVEEARARYDVRIRSLEDELEWFTKEALRLDDLAKLYKKEWDKWKTKAEALDEDRKFLEDQLKASKREIHTLRAAVERAQVSLANNLASQGSVAGGSSALVPINEGSVLGGTSTSLSMSKKNSARGKSTTLPAIHSSRGQQAEAPSHNSSQVLALRNEEENEGLKAEQEQRYLDIIASLKAQLEREQKANRQLRTSRTTAYAEKSELEEFFLKCVDEVRRDISRRRVQQQAGGALANKDSFSSFTQGDRKKVVELLLTSDDVLVFLYEKLFPHRTGGGLFAASQQPAFGGASVAPGQGQTGYYAPQQQQQASIAQQPNMKTTLGAAGVKGKASGVPNFPLEGEESLMAGGASQAAEGHLIGGNSFISHPSMLAGGLVGGASLEEN